jgi:activator of HSP90 ATPase
MVLHNPNNWHWVNKDVSAWTREYLQEKLSAISAEEDGVSAKVEKVLSMDGDVDVSQRKGKVITLYDVKLQLEYEGTLFSRQTTIRRHHTDNSSGKTKDSESVSGTITIPEVAHDTEEDEYVVCSLVHPIVGISAQQMLIRTFLRTNSLTSTPTPTLPLSNP